MALMEDNEGSNGSPEGTVVSIAHLTTGSTLLKAGRSGRPHYRRFQLSSDLTRINWESPRKGAGSSVYIKNIRKLIRGQETEVFKATPVPGYEAFSFSLIYTQAGVEERSLDLVCTERAEFDMWILALEALMAGFTDTEAVHSATQLPFQDRCRTIRTTKKGLEIEFGTLGGARVTRKEDSCDVYTWGKGWRGMLGHGEEMDEHEPKILDSLLTKDITQLALSRTFSIALSSQGEVFSWGSGKYGRLGHGNLRDRFLPLMIGFPLRGQDVTFVSCGEVHAAVVLDSGEVFTWGRAGARLGYDCDAGKQTHPRPVEALGRRKLKITMSACGLDCTVVLSESGEIFSFGDNEYGQLGAGTEPGILPAKDPEDEVVVCKVSTVLRAIKVVCGTFHSLLLSEKGCVCSWGRGDGGQLGHGDILHLGSPRQLETAEFPLTDPVRDIASGDAHSAFLLESGKVYTCGVKIGATGEQDFPEAIDHILVSPSRVACTSPKHVSLSNIVQSTIKQIYSGSSFVAGLTESKRVVTWGQNNNGQLGHRDTANRLKPAVVDALSDKAVESLFCGGNHMACTVVHSWVPDREANHCMLCNAVFTMVRRRHHCRKCGGIYCGSCTSQKFPLLDLGFSSPVRVCDRCFKKLNDDVVNA